MSGYIILTQRLTTKPEFRRVVRRVYEREKSKGVTLAQAECLALGYLTKLWLLADAHIADDDTLDITPDEVDQLLGVERSRDILGANYLEVLGPNDPVKLPGWHAHNDPSIRKAQLHAARQRRYRERLAHQSVTQQSHGSDATGDAPASQGGSPPFPSLPYPSKSERASGVQPPRSPDPRRESVVIHSQPGPGPTGPRFPELAAQAAAKK